VRKISGVEPLNLGRAICQLPLIEKVGVHLKAGELET